MDFWDTAGQERFQSMHASYYHGAHACVLVFDVGRKITYKNLDTWYEELVKYRGLKVKYALWNDVLLVGGLISFVRLKPATHCRGSQQDRHGCLPGSQIFWIY